MTPEGKVKKKVNKLLDNFSPICYKEMPVPTGFGKSGLDYTLCVNGFFLSIETKAPGEWLTPRQRQTAINILAAGGNVFVVSSDEGLGALERWLRLARDVDNPLHRTRRIRLLYGLS